MEKALVTTYNIKYTGILLYSNTIKTYVNAAVFLTVKS
jgi:hypothetical protein